MHKDIQKIYINQDELLTKIKELAQMINKDYEGKEVVLIPILKGSFMFAADLIRHITVDCNVDFMALSSYGGGTETSGKVKITKDLSIDISNKNVIVIEDIIDSGVSMNFLINYLKDKEAKSIEIASLLSKPSRRKVEINIKYMGFEVENEFLIGYGLDYNEKYRNLPYIGIIKPECVN